LVKSTSEDSTKEPDDDFLEYMLFGCSAASPSDIRNQGTQGQQGTQGEQGTQDLKERGYEMGALPISYIPKDINDYNKAPYTIPQCGNASAYTETICNKDKKDKFYYRVDADFKQLMHKTTKDKKKTLKNGEDEISYQFNSTNGSGDYQFIHLAYAILKQKGDTDNINKLKEKFKDVNIETYGNTLYGMITGNTITELIFRGGASKQDNKNSPILAKRRCTTLHHLVTKTFTDTVNTRTTVNIEENDIKNDSYGNSDYSIKESRYACVTFKYTVGKAQTANDSEKPKEEKKENNGSVLTKTVSKNHTRYEDEAQYFEKLQQTDYTTFKHLTKKFKYFTPAFHSISPEGFNARLTFLQQCTRQGHTIESRVTNSSGDKPTAVAGNLAFGRMPVCVLRIGDFMYTRILITSMNISYENNQWDLNPEGIGVQPMMAKVNLGITILGGQSLEGPISKLQNAVTFNYYANAGVYDDRADRAKPKGEDNKWSTDYYYTWEPEYLGGSEE
jgi:hypothetical protein